ncbi:hypothetical protein CU098_013661 [Rhizopus stolonifer]|uniref:Uncharacterized protein n=1 Tax=Rhizopus stolonifer TaxID=4846 RepID=A0A367KVD7_RHIST|nr:hypothetical protein CU098_013661 [Rhizopus stolonifer]
MKVEDLLELIESSTSNSFVNKKRQKEPVDTMLDRLDQLIELSTHIYLDTNFDDQEEDRCIVSFNDMRKANEMTNSIIIKIVSCEIMFNDGKDDERIERASRILAHMSGRGAAGSITRTWHIPFLNPDGDKREMKLRLHEPCYIGNDIGFKTWGAAPLLAKKLLQENLIPHLGESRVLELGSGTGMVGLVCDQLGAISVHMTDYHPRVLDNVAYNVKLNHSKATVSKLDFIEIANSDEPQEAYDIVIASDLLYEIEHAQHLPVAVNKLMKNEFYFMIPLRSTHWEEVECFEDKMRSFNFTLIDKQDVQVEEELEGTHQIKYAFVVSSFSFIFMPKTPPLLLPTDWALDNNHNNNEVIYNDEEEDSSESNALNNENGFTFMKHGEDTNFTQHSQAKSVSSSAAIFQKNSTQKQQEDDQEENTWEETMQDLQTEFQLYMEEYNQIKK